MLCLGFNAAAWVSVGKPTCLGRVFASSFQSQSMIMPGPVSRRSTTGTDARHSLRRAGVACLQACTCSGSLLCACVTNNLLQWAPKCSTTMEVGLGQGAD